MAIKGAGTVERFPWPSPFWYATEENHEPITPPVANAPLPWHQSCSVGLLSAIGCHAPPQFVDISGTVTVDGAPVSGTIYFWYPSYDDTVPAVVVSAPLDAQGSYSITLNVGMQYPIRAHQPPGTFAGA